MLVAVHPKKEKDLDFVTRSGLMVLGGKKNFCVDVVIFLPLELDSHYVILALIALGVDRRDVLCKICIKRKKHKNSSVSFTIPSIV